MLLDGRILIGILRSFDQFCISRLSLPFLFYKDCDAFSSFLRSSLLGRIPIMDQMHIE